LLRKRASGVTSSREPSDQTATTRSGAESPILLKSISRGSTSSAVNVGAASSMSGAPAAI
jgi:hypothetical protein